MICIEDKAEHFVEDETNFKSADHVSIATRLGQFFRKST